jgi:hypothetical protein
MKGYLVRRFGWIPAVLLPLVVAPAAAQSPASAPPPAPPGLELAVPPPSPAEPELRIEPTMPPEQQGAREQEFYPERVLSRHEPAFVHPFVVDVPTSRTSRARVGLSAWTAPRLPFDFHEATGGVAAGLTILWGAPPAPEAPPAPAAMPTGER